MTTPLNFRWTTALVALLAFTVAACDSTDPDPEPPPPDEFDQGFLVAVEVFGDDGALLINAYSEIPSEVDLSEFIEVGTIDGSAFAIGDGIFVFDGQGLYTKYVVDRSTLEISIDGTLDLTGLGVTGEFGNPIPFSETEAYFIAYTAGQIIQFNPQDIEQGITETISFEPLPLSRFLPVPSSNSGRGVFSFERSGSRIFGPVVNFDFVDFTSPFEAQMFVFDPATNSVSYDIDDRANGLNFLLQPTGDGSYLGAPRETYDTFLRCGDPPSPAPSNDVLLRVTPQGTFDRNFILDLNDAIDNYQLIRRVELALADEALISYIPDTETLPTCDESFRDVFLLDVERRVVNLRDGSSRAFNSPVVQALNGILPVGTVGGSRYFKGIPFPDSGVPSTLLRQDGLESFTTVLTLSSGNESVNAFAQLWGPGTEEGAATGRKAQHAFGGVQKY
ncbi:MAG: hypothetical protein AAGJ11_12550 [Bacteroidota bacterium]